MADAGSRGEEAAPEVARPNGGATVVEGQAEEATACTCTAVSCGSSHSVALIDSDCLVAFGRGEDGQLGLGDALERLEPRVVSTLVGKNIGQIACGAEYTIAVCPKEREVYSWGWGDFGRLGHGDCSDVFLPKSISALSGIPIVEIACGDTHTMAITAEGAVFGFGRNQNGQLGLGHRDDVVSPTPITALQGKQIQSMACGAEHTVAADAEGHVHAWGWGRYGNLGNGECTDRLLPTQVKGVDDVKMTKVACGWRHSCCVSESGDLYTFGWSRYGQLGHGDHVDRPLPTKVEGFGGKAVRTIAGGWRHTIALTRCGAVYAWGWNKFGQLGLCHSEDTNSPQEVSGFDGPVGIVACGWRHTLAVTASGQLYSWGRGVNGQLGHGAASDRAAPEKLPTLSSGSCAKAGLLAGAVAPTAYVSPADRYAVVPERAPATVPDAKRQRTTMDHAVPGA